MPRRAGSSYEPNQSIFAEAILDEDGNPLHAADDCDVCRMFSRQRHGETRQAWGRRLLGESSTGDAVSETRQRVWGEGEDSRGY